MIVLSFTPIQPEGPISLRAPIDDTADLERLILSMDIHKDVESIREQLVAFEERALPTMLACLPRLRKWQAREAIVYTAVKFARKSEVARRVGFVCLTDKSKRVRHHACALAAFSLDGEFLAELETLSATSDPDTAAHAQAAINAIERQRHHLFIDRQNTGSVFWNVGGSGIDT